MRDDLEALDADTRATHRARAVALAQLGAEHSLAGPPAALEKTEFLQTTMSSAREQRANERIRVLFTPNGWALDAMQNDRCPVRTDEHLGYVCDL